MSGFSADWLALREPADAAARSPSLTRMAADALRSRGPVRAVDLATGTGSNVRYLAPFLPADQEWLLVDGDERLLRTLPDRLSGMRSQARCADLSDLAAAGVIDGRTLVTASALLDLVSEAWVASLAALCARARAVVLLALSYDGRIACEAGDDQDDQVRALVNQHQRTDKGFGPALGPDAAACAADHFTHLGYRVTREPSDWVLTAEQGGLQRQLIEGWADAATEMAPSRGPTIAVWKTRRLAHVAAGRSRLRVGHQDLLAIPEPHTEG